jgi:DDE family transposase
VRAPVRICWPGVIVGVELMPAHVHDLDATADLAEPARGWLLADRNYWSPKLIHRLLEKDSKLLAPYRSTKRDPHPWPLWLAQLRRRIETVFSQLVAQFQAKVVWARDLWHLTSRWSRKILSHTLAVLLCQQLGLDSSLTFADLVTV